ncbi:MAG: PaaI family thioesterase [Thermoguttaceae bacterium]
MNEFSKESLLTKFGKDHFAMSVVGVEIVDASLNYAKTKLVVQPHHFNAVGIVQGGAVFTLADFAFAIAANAGQESVTVAIECHISYFKPTSEGTLFAEATLLSESRSLKSFDIAVRNEKGELVAKFIGRGAVRRKIV